MLVHPGPDLERKRFAIAARAVCRVGGDLAHLSQQPMMLRDMLNGLIVWNPAEKALFRFKVVLRKACDVVKHTVYGLQSVGRQTWQRAGVRA